VSPNNSIMQDNNFMNM